MAKEWYARVLGEVVGPMEPHALKKLAMSMRLTPDDDVRQGANGPWVRAKDVDGLFSSSKAGRRRPLTIAEVVRQAAAKRELKLDVDMRGAR